MEDEGVESRIWIGSCKDIGGIRFCGFICIFIVGSLLEVIHVIVS